MAQLAERLARTTVNAVPNNSDYAARLASDRKSFRPNGAGPGQDLFILRHRIRVTDVNVFLLSQCVKARRPDVFRIDRVLRSLCPRRPLACGRIREIQIVGSEFEDLLPRNSDR